MPVDEEAKETHVKYLGSISACFMIGAVARAMDPGCKHDHVPVIVGRDQGTLKSTAIRALCPDPSWFTDNIPHDLDDKDTKESLGGKWIIELSEIPQLRRDVEPLKAFISSRVDRYRAAYGRVTQDHPLQSVFIGTSNDLEFADTTGNRRFWPFISEGDIDVSIIIAERDQFWAEAVHLYHQGVKWWLDDDVEEIAEERQADFAASDVWDDLIREWCAKRSNEPFTMDLLFAKDTGIVPFRDTVMTQRADQMRAAGCLKRLVWRQSRCTLNGKRAMWWQMETK
jgi:predicted P-loop ATPase